MRTATQQRVIGAPIHFLVTVAMDDEDDLEFLRLAALKSLTSKRGGQMPMANSTTISTNDNYSNVVGHSIQVLASAPPTIVPPSTMHTYFPILSAEPNEPTLPKMDHIEPYVPTQNIFEPIKTTDPFAPSVQLSPRSAAFVSENYDILMKRKGTQPGSSRRSSHSPTYKLSTERWTPSPPPMKSACSRSPKSKSPISKLGDSKRSRYMSRSPIPVPAKR